MGVYIKGMEMPTSCYDCNFSVEAYEGSGVYACVITDNCVCKGAGMSDDCPLVPVPPHGRCIDADALADVFRGFIAMYDSCPFSQLSFTDKARRDELQAALAEVINAPTIIPAEEGE